jgi:hypothetical protein
VQQYLHQHARFPVPSLSPEQVEGIQSRLTESGSDEVIGPHDLLPIAERPEDIHVIVAGGPGKHSSWLPTFGRMTSPVTVPLIDHTGRPIASVEELRG